MRVLLTIFDLLIEERRLRIVRKKQANRHGDATCELPPRTMTSSDSSETASDSLIIGILGVDSRNFRENRELSLSEACVVFERLVAWSD